MGDYNNNPRLEKNQKLIEHGNDNSQINVSELASAVVKALKDAERKVEEDKIKKEFDAGGSMEKLANSMTVQRGSNLSNFEDLGDVKETKKDKKQTDKTKTLLSNLDN